MKPAAGRGWSRRPQPSRLLLATICLSIAALSLAAAVSGLAASRAHALRADCVRSGTAGPKIVEALVRHPGDWKKQDISATARWTSMPKDCDEGFLRRVRIRFQMQDPRNHRRWVAVGSRIARGGYVAPMLIGRDAEELEEEWKKRREAEGRSCWEKNATGTQEYTCPDRFEVGNRGGEATAEPPLPQNPTIRIPRRERYRCTPGPGVTHVRMQIRNRVIDLKRKKLAGQATRWVSLEVVRSSVPARYLGHRGQLPGPC